MNEDEENQIIMSVPVPVLFGNKKQNYFQGFTPASNFDYEQVILDNYEWTRRGNIEEDITRKQPIAYCLVADPLSREFFAYQRAKKHTESRLGGLLSLGFGGHIEQQDLQEGLNPIRVSLEREVLKEELNFPIEPKLSVLGYINDDENKVGQVHLGILYLAEPYINQIETKGDESDSSRLIHLDELKELELEPWSQIALPVAVTIIEKRKQELLTNILNNLDSNKPSNPELVKKVLWNLNGIELKEIKVKENGVGFEPRLNLFYDVLLDKEIIGEYQETRIFNKNSDFVTSFGVFD